MKEIVPVEERPERILAEIQSASEAFGAAREGAHIAAYTQERVIRNVTWLLAEGRFALAGLNNAGALVDAIRLEAYRLTELERKAIEQAVKRADPSVSIRRIATMLGVSKSLVHEDIVQSRTSDEQDAKENNDSEPARVQNRTPTLSGEEAARLVAQQEQKVLREAERQATRTEYEARAERGCEVSDLVAMAEAGRKFNVMCADPPWEFKVYSGKGKSRSAERYYDTSSLEAIKALPIGALAADNCALFLWGVWPELPGALEVIRAWGFEYKTAGFVWVKKNRGGEGLFTGMGYWTRANTEPCLLATRGAPQRLAMDVHQVIMEPVGEHSRKPNEARTRIERLLGAASPRTHLELFGRAPVSGWTVWGNEVEAASLAAE